MKESIERAKTVGLGDLMSISHDSVKQFLYWEAYTGQDLFLYSVSFILTSEILMWGDFSRPHS